MNQAALLRQDWQLLWRSLPLSTEQAISTKLSDLLRSCSKFAINPDYLQSYVQCPNKLYFSSAEYWLEMLQGLLQTWHAVTSWSLQSHCMSALQYYRMLPCKCSSTKQPLSCYPPAMSSKGLQVALVISSFSHCDMHFAQTYPHMQGTSQDIPKEWIYHRYILKTWIYHGHILYSAIHLALEP